MEQGRIQAVEVDDDAMFTANREAVAVLAAKRRLLSIGSTSFAKAGGLMSYGVDYFALFRRAAAFVDKILHGRASVASPPIHRPRGREATVLRPARLPGRS
jgi:putative ABC transport system substrate-binding protein